MKNSSKNYIWELETCFRKIATKTKFETITLTLGKNLYSLWLKKNNNIQLEKSLLKRFVSVAIDKATNDFTFSKKPYISKPLTEVGLSNSKSKTWSKATLSTKKKVWGNDNYSGNFDLHTTEFDKGLPMIYWLPKIHNVPIGARFVIVSKKSSLKPLSGTISNI